MGFSKSSSKKVVYSDTIIPKKKKKKLLIDSLTLHLRQLEKEEQKCPKSAKGRRS